MDPNLFHIDYERLTEVLVTIVILSMIIERALSIVFESRLFIEWTEKKKFRAMKESISFIVSAAVCLIWKFDAITVLLVSSEEMTVPGMIITGAVIAGGSKGSVKLFKDVLGFMSSAEKEKETKKEVRLETIKAASPVQKVLVVKDAI